MRLAPQKYSPFAAALHWLMAIMIAGLASVGLLFDDMTRESKEWWLNVHAAVGLSLLAFLVVRFAFRLTHRPPPLPADQGALTRGAAHAVHWALYLTMAVVPALGALTLFYRGRGVDYGLFRLASPFLRDQTLSRSFDRLHGLSAYLLLALAGVHICAALWHQLIRRDRLIARMMPASR